jgi:predicted DNA-binding transcriptional regulator YafY
MKIDRILEIIIYLLNHDNVSASFLAARFHVSTRTIQRDIVCISEIGIPIYSTNGKQGGYSILPTYKIKNSNIKDDEQQMIMKALESLSTSYTNDTLQNLIEKYNTLIDKTGGQKIFWDFGVSRENKLVQKTNELLERAILTNHFISFEYRNASNEKSIQYVQPLAIHYKWYAWYLFAFSAEKKGYRTYKVARISNICISEEVSYQNHGDIKKLMDESEKEYYKTCIQIELRFAFDECELVNEYFPDTTIEKATDHEYRTIIEVPAKERLWKALLLSFGNKIHVISPESYKNELIQTANDFLSNYDI